MSPLSTHPNDPPATRHHSPRTANHPSRPANQLSPVSRSSSIPSLSPSSASGSAASAVAVVGLDAGDRLVEGRRVGRRASNPRKNSGGGMSSASGTITPPWIASPSPRKSAASAAQQQATEQEAAAGEGAGDADSPAVTTQGKPRRQVGAKPSLHIQVPVVGEEEAAEVEEQQLS